MITSIDAFLRYFAGVNRRAVRDVGSLPVAAETWTPPLQAGDERGWGIGELVGHMAASRLFFVRAYCGEGWRAEPWPSGTRTRQEWISALDASAEQMAVRLRETPDAWLSRKVPAMDAEDREVSGWRVLMMGTEHDIHHRSQIDTYAGLAGWEVQQIFGRTAEEVGLTPRRPAV